MAFDLERSAERIVETALDAVKKEGASLRFIAPHPSWTRSNG